MFRLLILLLAITLAAQAQRSRRANRDAADPNDTRRNPMAGDDRAVTAGRDLYHRSCTNCHGPEGTVGDRAPALAGQRRFLRRNDGDLYDSIHDGIKGTGMPAMGLNAGDTWRVVAYIRSLRATAIDAPPSKGDPLKGEAVFWGKGDCGRCHMMHGRGGILGPDLSNAGAELRLQAIRDALTAPKPHPSAGYKPIALVTNDGANVRGVVKNENNFSLQVLGADGKLHLLLRSELRSIDYSAQIMPFDYDKRLGESYHDVVAFLSRQGGGRQ